MKTILVDAVGTFVVNGKVNEEGILVIGESYKLITFDVVDDPSTFAAFQEKVAPTTKRESVVETEIPQKNDNISVKNENRSINNNISKGWGIFGPNTKRAWANMEWRQEYLKNHL